MNDRLEKCLVCILMAPVLLFVSVVVALVAVVILCTIPLLPIIALVSPSSIKIKLMEIS